MAPHSKTLAREAGIDEVIVKPMSPRYLLERVIARTSEARRPVDFSGFRQRDWTVFGDNIVPLFPVVRHI